MKVPAVACLAFLAAGCGGERQETKPLPPPISLGAPEGGGGSRSAMPPGHPAMGMPAENPRPVPPVPDRFKPPDGWQAEAPSSDMRVAQFRIPRADGDARDGEVAVFGNAMGSTKANIERWRGQFTEVAQGKDSLEEITEGVNGKVILLDITGRYGGGMGAAPHGGGEDGTTRMLAAVIEAKDGTFYVKASGPPGTMGKWEKSIRDFILAAAK